MVESLPNTHEAGSNPQCRVQGGGGRGLLYGGGWVNQEIFTKASDKFPEIIQY